MNTEVDVVVIGGGAAGLSAALMLGRARRNVLVLDSENPRNRFAAHAHGLLGNEGIDPLALLQKGRDEAGLYGVRFANGVAQTVDATERGVQVTTAAGDVYSARAVVVASGMTDRLPDIPGLAGRWGRTVLHCPYCHGWEVRDRRLGVLVTSPHTRHLAEMVRQWSEHVVGFVTDPALLDDELEARLRSRSVEIVVGGVAQIVGDDERIDGVRLGDGRTGAVDALFAAGTPEPHDRFLDHLGLDRTETPFGRFLTVDPRGKTSADRIWAVGNVADPGANIPVAIAAGSMAGAAVNATLVADDFDRAAPAAVLA